MTQRQFTSENVRQCLPLLSLVVPLGVYGVSNWLSASYRAATRTLPIAVSPPNCLGTADQVAACAQALHQNAVYTTAWTIWIVIAVLSFFVAVLSIARAPKENRPLIYGVAVLLSAVVIYAVLSSGHDYAAIGCPDPQGCTGVFVRALAPGYIAWLDRSLDIANTAAAVATAFISVACAATVIGIPDRAPKGDSPAGGDPSTDAIARLRKLIVWAAVMVVAGIVVSSQYLVWPAPFLDTSQRAIFEAIVNGQLTIEGVTWTTVLLLIFFQPVAIVSARHLRRARREAGGLTLSQFWEQTGLPVFFNKSLVELLSIAAPLFFSQAAPLLKAIAAVG